MGGPQSLYKFETPNSGNEETGFFNTKNQIKNYYGVYFPFLNKH
jgi:hypothetical protein